MASFLSASYSAGVSVANVAGPVSPASDDHPSHRDSTSLKPDRLPNKKRGLATSLGLVGVALVAVIGGAIWYTTDQANVALAEQAAIIVEANYDPTACSQDNPIRLVVTYKAKRTLKSVSFALHAFEIGRSDVLALDSDGLESTAIVTPGKISTTCWKAPSLKRSASVVFRAEKNVYPEATFYDAGGFIPQAETPRGPDQTTAGGASSVPAPDVPPLLPNETPPTDEPNYFEPRELSSGGIVASFYSCEESARKSKTLALAGGVAG